MSDELNVVTVGWKLCSFLAGIIAVNIFYRGFGHLNKCCWYSSVCGYSLIHTAYIQLPMYS
jgi:hypothetical protein